MDASGIPANTAGDSGDEAEDEFQEQTRDDGVCNLERRGEEQGLNPRQNLPQFRAMPLSPHRLTKRHWMQTSPQEETQDVRERVVCRVAIAFTKKANPHEEGALTKRA